jgi:Tfp pilus assembly protein PilF
MTNPEKASASQSSRGKVAVFLYALLIAAASFAVFYQTLGYDFTNWDDNEYVTGNPDIAGFTAKNVTKVFSTVYVGNYQPLTLLSYMADFTGAGLHPTAYHRTNVLLHCVNGVLVFLFIAALVKHPGAAALAALFFALHPLRVESVAWVAERKDVLSALFYFAALLAWVHYVRSNKRLLYAASGVSMLLSFLAKPMAVTIPLIMLLIDVFENRKMTLRAITEKIPLLVLSGVFAAITVITQHGAGAIQEFPDLSLPERFGVPFYAVAFYLAKTIVPMNLCALYYQPPDPGSAMKAVLLLSPLMVAAVSIMAYVNRDRRMIIFGPAFFVVSLLPVAQIIPVGAAIVADRYTYIPSLGISCIVAAVLAWLMGRPLMRPAVRRTLLVTAVVILIAAEGVAASLRCRVWENSFLLWNDVIAKRPNPTAFCNRGTAYLAIGQYDMAINDFSEAVARKPDYAMAYSNRGATRLSIAKMRGDTSGVAAAVDDLTRAIAIDRTLVQAWLNRAGIYFARKQLAAAQADYDSACAVAPVTAQVYYNRGIFFRETQRFDAAIADFSTAIRYAPASAVAYNERGVTFAFMGNYNAAIADFRQCLTLDPKHPDALRNLNLVASLNDGRSGSGR